MFWRCQEISNAKFHLNMTLNFSLSLVQISRDCMLVTLPGERIKKLTFFMLTLFFFFFAVPCVNTQLFRGCLVL